MKKNKLICILCAVLLNACSNHPSTGSGSDDLSLQLEGIKKEIQSLRLETSQLRNAITEIHRSTVIQPSAGQAAAAPRKVLPEVLVSSNASVLGNSDAKVGIVEFSDYQCPFCSRFYKQTLPKIKEKFIDTGKVAFMYRDYPLAFHDQAKQAAIAANCAGRQKAFWKMHNELFDKQRELGPGLYQKLAKDLKLNGKKFSKCLQQNRQSDEVEKDIAYAQELGVTGTPTFFIGRFKDGKLLNAQRVTGAQPFSVFSEAINSIR